MAILLLICCALVAALGYWHYWHGAAVSAQLPAIALVDIAGEKSPLAYVKETGNLIQRGYNEYSKKGHAFSVPNISDFSSPLVVLPVRYLEEVSSAPQSKLSVKEYFSKFGLLQYSYGPPIADEVQHVARRDLNRAMNKLTTPLHDVCLSSFKTDMPRCKDWTSLRPYGTLTNIFVRMGARMLVGPELHKDWVDFSFEYLPAFMKATKNVRTGYHPLLRWTAKYVDPDVKAVLGLRARGAKMLTPVMNQRIQDMESSNTGQHEDAIQWLIAEHKSRGRYPTADDLVQNLLVMTISSTNQTAMIALWLLFDLIDHPDALSEIRAEIIGVQNGGSGWTRQKLGELRILDSFMTETMRVHSFTQSISSPFLSLTDALLTSQATVNRMVMQPWTFKDGLKLPVGVQISFPTKQYSLDEQVHPNPGVFEPKRHLQKRLDIDQAKYHFASTADTLTWGSGPHVCPGRFLVQDSLKLIFIHLLTNYDFKYPDDGPLRPAPDMGNGIMMAPDLAMPVLFKER